MSEDLVPIRGNLVRECVRVLEARIASGEWKGHLPGERRLAELLEVGRDTIRLAMEQLEKSGVISHAVPGMRRIILKAGTKGGSGAKGALRIGMLSSVSLERLPQSMLLEVDRVRNALAGRGGILKVFAPRWYESPNPGGNLRELLREESCHAWILHRASAAVQRAMEASGAPCLVRGYPHPGVGLSFLDVDWEATARHAAGNLWRLGHRRVAVLCPPGELRGVEAAVEGMRGLRESSFEVLPLEEDGTADGIGRVLGRIMRGRAAPTAVVATRPRQTASALTWLMANGFHVPARISVLSLGHDSFLDHVVPKVSGYRVPPEKVARRVLRRIEFLADGRRPSSGSPWLHPDFVEGGSIARLSAS